jgi:hypothetical protein
VPRWGWGQRTRPLIWASSSGLGLFVALVALWRASRLGIARVAVGVNALSLLVPLIGIVNFILGARAWERAFSAGGS